MLGVTWKHNKMPYKIFLFKILQPLACIVINLKTLYHSSMIHPPRKPIFPTLDQI